MDAARNAESSPRARPEALRVLVDGVAARVGSGGATYLIEQVAALAALDGVALTVHVTGELADHVAPGPRIRVVRHPPRPLPMRLLWEQTVLAREARRHDVVWATGNFALLLAPRPQLLTAQNIWYFATPGRASPRPPLLFRARTALQRPLARASVRRARRVVAVSATMADAIGGDVTTVLNALPALPEHGESGVPSDRYVLSVSHDLAHKDWDRVVEGVADAPGLPPLVLVGDCPARRREALAARVRAGRVLVLGVVADRARLAALYRGASCVVVHSHLESFGLTACEALSAGAAVAASDIPAHREVCRGAAHLYDPGSALALRDAVNAALVARPPGAQSWSWPHSWDAGARELRAILERIGRP
jgi:glycosyltransferase involved in cell wall biosynthesis